MLVNTSLSPRKREAKKVPFRFSLLLIVILFGTTLSLYYKNQKLLKCQDSTQKEAHQLAAAVRKLMLLPEAELPSIATVVEAEKLKLQPFFENAQNGQKILIFPNSELAIIYDPTTNLIINTGPINFPLDKPQIQKTHVGLRNGTNVAGLTHKLEAEIQRTFSDIDFVFKDQDKQTNYEKTIVIVLNETSKDVATELAKTLDAQLGELPNNEPPPEGADILVIVGKDKV